ncbi:hypothetical protein FQZ97_570110 [compost metagenome]
MHPRLGDHTGFEALGLVVVLPGVEVQRLQLVDLLEASRVAPQIANALLFGEACRHPGGVRGKNGESGIGQDAVVDGPQHVVKITINAVGLVQGGCRAGRDTQHGLLALEVARAVFLTC